MSIQKIEVYKTSDGKQFENIDEASRHQQEIDEAPVRYCFNVTLAQTFTSPYEVEGEDSPEGLKKAIEEAREAFEEDFKQVIIARGKDWDYWEPQGKLKVLDIEFVELV